MIVSKVIVGTSNATGLNGVINHSYGGGRAYDCHVVVSVERVVVGVVNVLVYVVNHTTAVGPGRTYTNTPSADCVATEIIS